MTFETCVACILEIEKGYVSDSNDPGGETNWGISKRQYPALDIKNLSKAEATAIYFKDYWTPIKPLLVPPRLRLCLFDAAVNHGVDRAVKILQAAVGAQQDGVLGPKTLEALRIQDELLAFSTFMQVRLSFMGKLPQWVNFSNGWAKRLVLVAMWTFTK